MAGDFVGVPPPAFSVSPGLYSQPLTVAITDPAPGLTIRYTTTPGATAGDLSAWSTYTQPITLSGTANLRAYAYSAAANPSPTASGFYTLGSLIGGQVIGPQPLNLAPTATSPVVASPVPAGPALGSVVGVACDGRYLYFTSQNLYYVGRVDLSNDTQEVLAGSSGVVGSGTSADDGVGAASRWVSPSGITLSSGNALYVSDGNRIREINLATLQVTTIAGSGSTSGYTDAADGASALFNGPGPLAVIGSTLYVADYYNHVIRSVGLAPPYPVSTLISTPEDPMDSGQYFGPTGITTNGTSLFVTLGWDCCRQGNVVWEIANPAAPAGTVLAGELSVAGWADSPSSPVLFDIPQNVCTDGTYLYVVEWQNYDIRRVTIADGTTLTIAGQHTTNGFTNGVGSAATFGDLYGCTSDGTNLYVADPSNQAIREVSP